MATKTKPTTKEAKKTEARERPSTKRNTRSAAPKKLSLAIPNTRDFEVKAFCRRYKIVRPDLTRLTGYSLRAVDKWAAGEKPAAPAKKQLAELVRLFDALADLMENEDVGTWLKTPNPAFSNSTPLQVIERGETDRIWRMIYQLETGEPA